MEVFDRLIQIVIAIAVRLPDLTVQAITWLSAHAWSVGWTGAAIILTILAPLVVVSYHVTRTIVRMWRARITTRRQAPQIPGPRISNETGRERVL